MKKDIETMEDIQFLVNSFYQKVRNDDTIGHFFSGLSPEKWAVHLKVMYGFWHNAIFFSGLYSGNPMETHQRINSVFPMEQKHFERWNQLFTETAESLFEGQNNDRLIQTAITISTIMQLKINNKPPG
ncbi:MAG: group III truncated hemoglobin [Bacteroidia bacterium]|nr:group III truncated hemoglobin [Bacteroidia bacterium]